jgi:hypothetical protein
MSLSRLRWSLAGVCAVLVALLAFEILAPLPEWTPPSVPPAAVSIYNAEPRPFVAPPTQAYLTIDARPVFSPARTPVGPLFDAVAGGTEGRTSLGDMSLVGIILDRGTRLAMLRTPSSPMAVALSVGSTIDGWLVVEIDDDHVVLRSNGSDQVLVMSRNNGPPAPSSVSAEPQ